MENGELGSLGVTTALSFLWPASGSLTPGTRYVFFVRARSEDHTPSAPSNSAFVDIPPLPDVVVAVPHLSVRTDPGPPDEALISWSHRAPQSPIVLTGFELQYCEVPPTHDNNNCDMGWKNNTNDPLSPATRNLVDAFGCDPNPDMAEDPPPPPPARMYRMRATANMLDARISSPYSDHTRPICPGVDYPPPPQVEALFVGEAGPPAIQICWNVPEGDPPALTGYELQITLNDALPPTESGWHTIDAYIDPTSDPQCYFHSGLASEDARWFRVRAYNLAGHGHWSAHYHYVHASQPTPMASSTQEAVSFRSLSADSVLPVLSVAPAVAEEHSPAGLVFTVSMTPASDTAVRARYRTESGSAVAGRDFEAASGVLEIPAGESGTTVAVRLFDDEEPEGAETLVLRLSEPEGARIGQGEATGTIEPSDPTPQAWLSRFGQSFTIGAVDAVRARVAAPSAADTYAPWVRVGARGFSALDPYSKISGSMRLLSVGLDRAAAGWQGGIGLTHGTGSGSHGDADFDADLSAIHPYLALHLDPRFTLWGTVGAGTGSVRLDSRLATDSADVTWRFGAGGIRGGLLSSAEGDPFDMDWTADASWAEIESSAHGILRSSGARFTRLSSGVDLARSMPLGDASLLAPSLSLALVHDDGDANEGTGLDAEVALRYEAPQHGVSAGAELSHLVASGDADTSGWGIAGSLAYDPGDPGRGLSPSITPRAGRTEGAEWSPFGSLPSSETSLDTLARYGRGASRWSPYAGMRLVDDAGYRAGFDWLGHGGSSMRVEARTGAQTGIWSQGALRW